MYDVCVRGRMRVLYRSHCTRRKYVAWCCVFGGAWMTTPMHAVACASGGGDEIPVDISTTPPPHDRSLTRRSWFPSHTLLLCSAWRTSAETKLWRCDRCNESAGRDGTCSLLCHSMGSLVSFSVSVTVPLRLFACLSLSVCVSVCLWVILWCLCVICLVIPGPGLRRYSYLQWSQKLAKAILLVFAIMIINLPEN